MFAGSPSTRRAAEAIILATPLGRLVQTATGEAPMFDWLRFWDRRRNRPKNEERRPAPPPPPAPDAPPVAPEHEPLLRALDDPSPEARYRAAEELARVGAPVVPALA